MKVLGVSCSFWHDPSAALIVDGEIVAAAEQERFSRRKHAVGEIPVDAVRYCLEAAKIRPEDVDLVAYPWSISSIEQNRFRYVARALGRRTSKALKALVSARRQQKRRLEKLEAVLTAIGLKPSYGGKKAGHVEVECVEHHLAHASSAYHFSGFDESAVMTIDGMGEITTCLFGLARGGKIEKIHEIQKPDSLGLFYAAMTEYLGFEHNDGEYKVMGMASYGDASRIDLDGIVTTTGGDLRIDTDYVWTPREKRWRADKPFGKKLVERFGPPREGDEIDEPYIHIAAAVQKRLEDATFDLLDYHLKPVLEKTRRLCFAGGCALNVVLNRKLMGHPLVQELWVQPGAGDSGLSLGAASYAAARRGERVKPQKHAYLGPRSTTDEVRRELDSLLIPYEVLEDAPAKAAELLAAGEVVAWFQGRMEWGPRALGNRSILGHPGKRGVADDINGRIKYRERWRPFCPSVLEERAASVLGSRHPSPFMTHSFVVSQEWKDKIPEVVHVDGTARPQVVSRETNPRFHRLISEFERRTGLPCVVNTSLNRRGEPIVMTPKDALAMFYGSGLEFLVMEDVLVTKRRG